MTKIKVRKTKCYLIGPVAAVIAAAAIITVLLFVSPIIGMEDNGDFSRATYAQGLYDLPENSEILYDGYFIKEYGIMQYFNEYKSTVKTSQFLLIQPAILLDRLLTGNDDVFDIRFLGLLHMVYFLVVLFFLVEYLTHRLSLISSLAIAAVCVFMFADTGYIAYFNSFFSEPLAYVSLLGCVTCALLYAEDRYNKYLLLLFFLVNGLILTFSKQQFAPIGVLMGIFVLFFLIKKHKGWLFKTLIFVSSAGLITAGITMYLLISEKFTNINLFHSMTRGVLLTSDDPPETLDYFGIDNQYELLNKNIYFARYPLIDAEDERLADDFYSKYDIFEIVGYYAQNPSSFVEMLKMAAQNAYMIRPTLGNYEFGSGYEQNEQSSFFSLYSSFKEQYAPKTIGFIIIWTLVALALFYRKRLTQITVLLLILAGLSQMAVSIIGAGDADLAKHVFLYNVAFDAVNVIMISHVIAFTDRKYRENKQRKKPATIQEELENVDDAIYKNT